MTVFERKVAVPAQKDSSRNITKGENTKLIILYTQTLLILSNKKCPITVTINKNIFLL